MPMQISEYFEWDPLDPLDPVACRWSTALQCAALPADDRRFVYRLLARPLSETTWVTQLGGFGLPVWVRG